MGGKRRRRVSGWLRVANSPRPLEELEPEPEPGPKRNPNLGETKQRTLVAQRSLRPGAHKVTALGGLQIAMDSLGCAAGAWRAALVLAVAGGGGGLVLCAARRRHRPEIGQRAPL